jgi:hypothetical protein
VEGIRIRYKTPMHMHKTHMQSSTIRCNHILIHSRIERHIALGMKWSLFLHSALCACFILFLIVITENLGLPFSLSLFLPLPLFSKRQRKSKNKHKGKPKFSVITMKKRTKQGQANIILKEMKRD